MTDTRPTVAVIGGGYGGINVARSLDAVADVVLVEPNDSFHHNVAALRALVDPSWVARTFFSYDRLLTQGRVVPDRAVGVRDGEVRLASGAVLNPDYIVLATGSTYPFPAKSAWTTASESAARYQEAYDNLAKAPRVMLVGAGPVGIELAGEIAAVWPEKQIVLVEAADDVLPGPYDPRVRAEIHRQLDELAVRRVTGAPLTVLPDTAPGEPGTFSVVTTDGVAIEADLWFQCYGNAPATDYLAGSPARTPEGYVDVEPDLRVVGTSTVYAVGDIVSIDVNRAGAAARHAAVVVANIQARLAGRDEVTTYAPAPTVILLPIGPAGGTGQIPTRDGPMPAEMVANIKGRDMMIDRYEQLFTAPPKSDA